MRIRALLATAAISMGSVALLAPPAQAAAKVCFSVSVTVNGEQVVNEAQCHEV